MIHKLYQHKQELEREISELLDMDPTPRVEAALAPLIERWNAIDKACQRMGEKKATEALTDDDLAAWLDGMDNADGTHGAHWTQAQTTAVGDNIGIDWGKVSPKCWHVAMNMMYSDYFGTAAKFKQTGPEFFAELAKDFLMDPDGGSPREKLAGYYHGIVKNARKD